MSSFTRKKTRPVQVKIGKRFHIKAEMVENDDGETVITVISMKWWFLTLSSMTVSVILLVLQVASLLD